MSRTENRDRKKGGQLPIIVIPPPSSFPMVLIALIVKLTSKGPALYCSGRIGKDNTVFKMPKFRTMR
jgi:lipopolysaccharide/colanic/teichoic acid biosynthesis glycosyltransferase